MINNLSELARSIQDSAAPRWLTEYISQHRHKIVAELQLFGNYDIPMPDGGTIMIRSTDKGLRVFEFRK